MGVARSPPEVHKFMPYSTVPRPNIRLSSLCDHFLISRSFMQLRPALVIRYPGGGGRFSAPVQTGPGAHPASYTVGTGPFHGR